MQSPAPPGTAAAAARKALCKTNKIHSVKEGALAQNASAAIITNKAAPVKQFMLISDNFFAILGTCLSEDFPFKTISLPVLGGNPRKTGLKAVSSGSILCSLRPSLKREIKVFYHSPGLFRCLRRARIPLSGRNIGGEHPKTVGGPAVRGPLLLRLSLPPHPPQKVKQTL